MEVLTFFRLQANCLHVPINHPKTNLCLSNSEQKLVPGLKKIKKPFPVEDQYFFKKKDVSCTCLEKTSLRTVAEFQVEEFFTAEYCPNFQRQIFLQERKHNTQKNENKHIGAVFGSTCVRQRCVRFAHFHYSLKITNTEILVLLWNSVGEKIETPMNELSNQVERLCGVCSMMLHCLRSHERRLWLCWEWPRKYSLSHFRVSCMCVSEVFINWGCAATYGSSTAAQFGTSSSPLLSPPPIRTGNETFAKTTTTDVGDDTLSGGACLEICHPKPICKHLYIRPRSNGGGGF